MTEIKIETLTLKNFKGVKDLTVNFNGVTNIYGENSSGKTTVNDAFRWLLFGKDSSDRKQFEIKTLDENNHVIHGLDHSVIGEISVSGKVTKFEKIFREKWQKKRGATESTFTGHETQHIVNDVPVSASDYQKEIDHIVDEPIFKLLTDPFYFSNQIAWQDRRGVLLELSGDITIADVLDRNSKLTPLVDILNGSDDIDKLKKGIAARKKKINDSLKAIPVRIDECNNSIVEVDAPMLCNLLQLKERSLKDVENELYSTSNEDSSAVANREKLKQLRSEVSKIQTVVYRQQAQRRGELENELAKYLADKSSNENQLKCDQQDYQTAKDNIAKLKVDIEKYGAEFDEIKVTAFEIDDDFICPTCKRPLDADVVAQKKEEMRGNFNAEKAKKLDDINKLGVRAKNLIKENDTLLDELGQRIKNATDSSHKLDLLIQEAQEDLKQYDADPFATIGYPEEYHSMQTEISELEKVLEAPRDTNIDSLLQQKQTLISSIDNVKSQLGQVESNKHLQDRITVLKAEEKELAQKYADMENQEYLVEEFIKTKVELLESKINSLFTYVRFKLFDTQINGAVVETCVPMVHGVPFPDCNNAAKYNAGIDIINALSKHYGLSAPIIIDNREGVNELIPTSAQIINLIVSRDKKLKVA